MHVVSYNTFHGRVRRTDLKSWLVLVGERWRRFLLAAVTCALSGSHYQYRVLLFFCVDIISWNLTDTEQETDAGMGCRTGPFKGIMVSSKRTRLVFMWKKKTNDFLRFATLTRKVFTSRLKNAYQKRYVANFTTKCSSTPIPPKWLVNELATILVAVA